MADAVHLAQDFYDLAKQDVTFYASLRTTHSALLASVATGEVMGDVVQGSKNGASYTMRPSFTVQDRLTALKLALSGLERGIRPSRTSRVTFC